MNEIKANEGKKLNISVDGIEYSRFPIKTHVIMPNEDIVLAVKKYIPDDIKNDDIVFVSEKIVAISQNRAYKIEDIKPGFWAKFLSKLVFKSPYGIGLGSPYTMELAIREAGLFKILIAAKIGFVCKLFGKKGVFYKIVGKDLNAIDGPCECTIPPYNRYAKLAPKDPNSVASKIKEAINVETVIIDANDLGVNVLGKSNKNIDSHFCEMVFKDNPLGQSSEQTPIAIVRKI